MNDIINKFSIDPIVKKYGACGSFTKHKQRIQKFMETGDTRYIYKNKLDEACFQHDKV